MLSGPSTRARDAGRGVLALAVIGAVVAVIIGSAGSTWNADPEVTASVPATSGQIRPQATVQFRGVTVGALQAVEASADRTVLRLRVHPDQLGLIPAGVRARLVPRTLFGDQFVDLAPPADSGGAKLKAGAVLQPDTSTGTVQLYEAFTRMYELINAIQPAKLNAALGTLADVLRGRGDQLGSMLDQAADVVRTVTPSVNAALNQAGGIADLAKQLSASAPDLFGALDDAVALSQTIVDKRDNIASLLASGIALGDRSQQLLADNASKVIQLVREVGPVLDVASSGRDRITQTLRQLGPLLDATGRVLSGGPQMNVKITIGLTDLRPYTAADCPRYPGLSGPNCGAAPSEPPPAQPLPLGGTSGPVGSPQEKQTMNQLLPQLGVPPAPTGPDLLNLLLGPILRGTQVLVR